MDKSGQCIMNNNFQKQINSNKNIYPKFVCAIYNSFFLSKYHIK